jgi:hypothetical protein
MQTRWIVIAVFTVAGCQEQQQAPAAPPVVLIADIDAALAKLNLSGPRHIGHDDDPDALSPYGY